MKSVILAALFALPIAANADTVRTRIFRVDSPTSPGMEHEVLATGDGRVYFAPSDNSALLGKLKDLAVSHSPVKIVTDEGGESIVAAEALTGDEASAYADDFDQPQVQAEAFEAMGSVSRTNDGTGARLLPKSLTAARALGYEPTILESVSAAQALYNTERELKHKSQCYERAHVWSREFEINRGVKSMKVFMFFTDRFRHRFTHKAWGGLRTRPYKWWFHVAPFVYVDGQASMQEFVLDREFLSQAVSMNDWTFEFIGKVNHDNDVPYPTYGEALCQDASAYREFSADRNPARYCVLRKVPMYYFQPLDLDALDCQKGSTSTTCLRTVVRAWRESELQWAYKNTKR